MAITVYCEVICSSTLYTMRVTRNDVLVFQGVSGTFEAEEGDSIVCGRTEGPIPPSFVNWSYTTSTGSVTSTDDALKFTLEKDSTGLGNIIQLIYTDTKHTITPTAENGSITKVKINGVEASSPYQAFPNAEIEITAEADNLYHLKQWEVNSVPIGITFPLTFKMDKFDYAPKAVCSNATPNYLKFTTVGTTEFYINNPSNVPDIKYSFDGSTDWTVFPTTPAGAVKLDSTHPSMYLKGHNTEGFSLNPKYPSSFKVSGSGFKVSGNVMSLVDEIGEVTFIPNGCFAGLFLDCTQLLEVDDNSLPAITLNDSCYAWMFRGCTNLTKAPTLPATVMKPHCYAMMFQGCTSLVTPPALPADTAANLAEECYYFMFEGCTSLVQSPTLPTKVITKARCYKGMFKNCTSLRSVTCGMMAVNESVKEEFAYEWLYNVSDVGSFTTSCVSDWETGANGIPDTWTRVNTDSFMKIVPEGTATIYLKTEAGDAPNCMQSSDGTNWWGISTTEATKMTFTGPIFLKGNNSSGFSTDDSNYSHFVITGNVSVSGSVMALISNGSATPATTVPSGYCFYKLFADCPITTAPELTATTLNTNCYNQMFKGCTSLTAVPSLPAASLSTGCYMNMFEGCTSLTVAPSVISATLASHCCVGMFSGCTGIITPPQLTATTLAESCYQEMFQGCTSLINAPELPATTLAQYCYEDMFNGCTSMITAPDLPATTLVTGCYTSMFYDCEKIEGPITISATNEPTTTFVYEMFVNAGSQRSAIASRVINVKGYTDDWIANAGIDEDDWTVETFN